jgi:hypothetical protein
VTSGDGIDNGNLMLQLAQDLSKRLAGIIQKHPDL